MDQPQCPFFLFVLDKRKYVPGTTTDRQLLVCPGSEATFGHEHDGWPKNRRRGLTRTYEKPTELAQLTT